MRLARRRLFAGSGRVSAAEPPRQQRLLGLALHRQARLLPRGEAAREDAHAPGFVALVDQLGRQTGGALVGDSGSVEDEKPVARKLVEALGVLALRMEVVARDVGPRVRDGFTNIDDEERLATPQSFPGLGRADPRDVGERRRVVHQG